ncbi:MAG TPA: hypothetical protein GX715_16165 [Armatimonadetes bacterium]|nr:hypothetical protein [Armatimonadota bacterium]
MDVSSIPLPTAFGEHVSLLRRIFNPHNDAFTTWVLTVEHKEHCKESGEWQTFTSRGPLNERAEEFVRDSIMGYAKENDYWPCPRIVSGIRDDHARLGDQSW